ncbi:peptidylprolyl isomerase [Ningiella sp. W23]|uniref:peptidylprolyl isomerase n=1 Tax=Ningiella sp. W23 TaxID=3023715 RepID=UPI003756C1AB
MSLTNTPDIMVNGTTIPAAAIDTEVQYHPAESRRQAIVEAAQSLIIAELIAQKAKEKGLTDSVDRERLEKEPELIDALFAQEVYVPTATDDECVRYFEANPEQFRSSPLVETRHILLAADPKDLEHRAEMLTIAEQLISQIKSKEIGFSQAAKQYSVCPSKEQGGSLGQLSSGQTVSEFERQVFAADLGLMEVPVESRFGYHIVDVVRKIEGKALTYDLVEDKIQKYLNDKVHRKAISQYLHRLVSEADIKGFEFDIDASMLMQ